jgi:hypothetical protein
MFYCDKNAALSLFWDKTTFLLFQIMKNKNTKSRCKKRKNIVTEN